MSMWNDSDPYRNRNEKIRQDNSVSVSIYDKFSDRKMDFPPLEDEKKLFSTLCVCFFHKS